MRNPQWRMVTAASGSGLAHSLRPDLAMDKGATRSIRVFADDYVCLVLGSEPQGSPGPIV